MSLISFCKSFMQFVSSVSSNTQGRGISDGTLPNGDLYSIDNWQEVSS